jgi:hypothetical protein
VRCPSKRKTKGKLKENKRRMIVFDSGEGEIFFDNAKSRAFFKVGERFFALQYVARKL